MSEGRAVGGAFGPPCVGPLGHREDLSVSELCSQEKVLSQGVM